MYYLEVVPMVQNCFELVGMSKLFWNYSEEKIKQLKGGGARNRESTALLFILDLARSSTLPPVQTVRPAIFRLLLDAS